MSIEAPNASRIALMLRLYRAQAGISRDQLAEDIGMNIGALERLEHGRGCNWQNGAKIVGWLTSPESAPAENGEDNET